MLELVTAALNLAIVVGTFIQTEELLKYVREMKSIQDDLNLELGKPVGVRDDAKVETLYASFKTTLAAFQNQVAVLQNAKTGAAPAPAPAAK